MGHLNLRRALQQEALRDWATGQLDTPPDPALFTVPPYLDPKIHARWCAGRAWRVRCDCGGVPPEAQADYPPRVMPTLSMVLRDHVARALAEAGANKRYAARLLGITRRMLATLLEAYKIPIPPIDPERYYARYRRHRRKPQPPA